MVAATVHATVNAIRDRRLSFMGRIILLWLSQRREHGLGREPVLEGTTPPSTAPESASCEVPSLSEAARAGGGPVPRPPSEGDAFDEVALRLETKDIEVDHLSCACVAQGEVGGKRGLLLGKGSTFAASSSSQPPVSFAHSQALMNASRVSSASRSTFGPR